MKHALTYLMRLPLSEATTQNRLHLADRQILLTPPIRTNHMLPFRTPGIFLRCVQAQSCLKLFHKIINNTVDRCDADSRLEGRLVAKKLQSEVAFVALSPYALSPNASQPEVSCIPIAPPVCFPAQPADRFA